jgi:SAM-dependent methyltransferase
MPSQNRKPEDPEDGGLFDDAYFRILEPFHTEEDARRETAAVREVLGLAQGDRVLDLACGWGRHLALLVQAGHRVTGLDRSLPLLRRARRELASRGTHSEPGTFDETRLIAADLLRLPLVDQAFDAVLNLATSLGLFLDDADAVRALDEMRRVLRPGGRLLLEGMHRADVEAHFAARDTWTLPDGTRVRARRRLDVDRGVSHEILRWRGPGGAGEKRHSIRLRTATEWVRLLDRAGLRTRATYGSWQGKPFTDASPRFIALAVRA